MKCDELEKFDATSNADLSAGYDHRYAYDAEEVENAIDELKAAHHKERHEYIEMVEQLKAKLEDAKATAYAESVDAGMENVKLKRALWLARAERASDKARIFYFAETCGVELNIDGFSNKEKGRTKMCTSRWWRLTWLKVERKCRAMAEKFGG